MATKKATASSQSAARKTAARKKTSETKTVTRQAAPKNAAATKSEVKKAPAKKAAGKASPRASAAKQSGQHAAPKKTSTPDKYSDPGLRERIKAKVIREDKGGRAGQWSARKAQMVAHEYEAAGGTYKGDRDDTQKSLTDWGDEHWTTQDGKPALRNDGMHRYLPEKAWKELSPAEKRSTEKKKLSGDHRGKQYVANTGSAVKARHNAEKKPSPR